MSKWAVHIITDEVTQEKSEQDARKLFEWLKIAFVPILGNPAMEVRLMQDDKIEDSFKIT